MSRPNASHDPRHIDSSTISLSVYSAFMRVQNSSSSPWWSSAYRSAYSAASFARVSRASVVRQFSTSVSKPSSTFTSSISVRQSWQKMQPLICDMRSRAASNSRRPRVVSS